MISEALEEPFEMDSSARYWRAQYDAAWAFTKAVSDKVESLCRAEEMRTEARSGTGTIFDGDKA